MSESMNRRHFLISSSIASAGLGLAARSRAGGAGAKLVAGVMGAGVRGPQLARTFMDQPELEIAYVSDPDSLRAGKLGDAVTKKSGKSPKVVQDFRRILDDKGVDILIVAAPNHWHGPATILGCSAGKHVYIEKPCSHNPHEGELMVQAARKYDRRVQMGTQRRSFEKIMEGIQRVREGAIGRAYLAQSWYTNNRKSIGHAGESSVPKELDWDLWQGPAPRRPFHSNFVHYNWHWFWHWGNGEFGNNGVHYIDLSRWGLGVDYPVLASSVGGHDRYQDDQETPDTNIVTLDFPDRKTITWTGLSCNKLPGDMKIPEVLFQGDNGSLAIMGGGYRIYDPAGKEVKREEARHDDDNHIKNFLESIRGNQKLNCEIEEGFKSTLLCHLGNISYRTGRTVHCDPKSGRILNDPEAMQLWTRQYEKGWEPHL